jgi:hypothetical protein
MDRLSLALRFSNSLARHRNALLVTLSSHAIALLARLRNPLQSRPVSPALLRERSVGAIHLVSLADQVREFYQIARRERLRAVYTYALKYVSRLLL